MKMEQIFFNSSVKIQETSFMKIDIQYICKMKLRIKHITFIVINLLN